MYFRCCCIDTSQAQEMCNQWEPEMDAALVQYINRLCQHLSISPARLHPHEVYLTSAEMTSIDYAPLQGKILQLSILLVILIESHLAFDLLHNIDIREHTDRQTSSRISILSSKSKAIWLPVKILIKIALSVD